jgi:hypothetical protein
LYKGKAFAAPLSLFIVEETAVRVIHLYINGAKLGRGGSGGMGFWVNPDKL